MEGQDIGREVDLGEAGMDLETSDEKQDISNACGIILYSRYT
jgi:hypothetical protein